jgi:hypothetical protein
MATAIRSGVDVERKLLCQAGGDRRHDEDGSKSVFRAQYNALGKRNLSAIERIATARYRRGAAFNRQHPILRDITESGEVLDVGPLMREGSPP